MRGAGELWQVHMRTEGQKIALGHSDTVCFYGERERLGSGHAFPFNTAGAHQLWFQGGCSSSLLEYGTLNANGTDDSCLAASPR